MHMHMHPTALGQPSVYPDPPGSGNEAVRGQAGEFFDLEAHKARKWGSPSSVMGWAAFLRQYCTVLHSAVQYCSSSPSSQLANASSRQDTSNELGAC